MEDKINPESKWSTMLGFTKIQILKKNADMIYNPNLNKVCIFE